MSIEDTTIDEKIEALPPEERERFDKELHIKMQDHEWLENHCLSDVHPSVLRASRILYREEYVQESGGCDGEGEEEAYEQMFKKYNRNKTS